MGHTQVCTSLQTDNHASTPPLSFLQAGCPSCRPTNSVKAQKAHNDNRLWPKVVTIWKTGTASQTHLIVMLELLSSQLEMFLSPNSQLRQSPAGIDSGLVKLVFVADKKSSLELARRCQCLPYSTVTKHYYQYGDDSNCDYHYHHCH